MVKRVVVTGLKARGYVDGRYVGEEKKEPNAREDVLRGRKRRGKSGGIGVGAGAGAGKRGGKRGPTANMAGGASDNFGNTVGGKRGRRGKSASQVLRGAGVEPGNSIGQALPHGDAKPPRGPRGQPRPQSRKNISGRKTPFRKTPMAIAHTPSPSQIGDTRRVGEEAKSGQFAEALAAQANVKRERLHKVMAQSGIGSRRDMEIMISTGRVMVNGIVATTGTQVSPGDNVLVDQRPVKLKFSEELPRILLYHKPEGEIVTTSDPGNRITVFDNLPPVETGKWIAIGRLDINTSGLLIFTTNGELANRFMHPRYEVEREYAVRILGELTDEQTDALLTGVKIDSVEEEIGHVDRVDHADHDMDDEPDHDHAPPLHGAGAEARFDTIEKRGGEGANHWYQVTIKEGRNREVRKMFESQGLTVSRLIRTRFGKIELPPRLSRGKMMELSPDQVRSILAGAGMKDEADAALPGEMRGDVRGSGRGDNRGGARGKPRAPGVPGPRGPKPPRGGQPRNEQPRDGNRPPREGNAGAAESVPGQEHLPGAPRPRRNRRGSKGVKRDPTMQGTGNNVSVNLGADESSGNRGENRGNRPPPAARVAAEPHDNLGNAVEGAGNVVTNSDAAAPAGPRTGPRGPRGRQRRNFRGRGGRNRGPRGENGEGGGGEDGGGNNSGGGDGNAA